MIVAVDVGHELVRALSFANGADGFAHFLRPILLAALADCGNACAPHAG